MFEAFQFGPVLIWMRLTFLLVAIWLSTEFFLRLAATASLSLQSIRDYAWWHLGSFVFFGRMFAVVADYQWYSAHAMNILIMWDGAFSFIGAIFGIALVLFWATGSQRATFLQWLDVLLPAATFGLSIDWLGMFLAAESYGKPTNVPWGITLDTFSVRYTVPIHPVQLYYALFFLFLTFILLLIRKHSVRAGSETLFGIATSSLAFFFFEFLRGDFGIPVFAMMTDFLFLGSLFFSLGILALIEEKISERTNALYGVMVALLTLTYVLIRPWIDFPQFQLRFSQILAILSLLATSVYVVVHRRKYPHL